MRFAFIVFILFISSALQAADFEKSIFLDLTFHGGAVELTDRLVAYASPPTRVMRPDGLILKVLSAQGSELYAYGMPDPRLVFVDNVENGVLSGGQFLNEEAEFSVTLPYDKRAARLVISDGKGQVGSIDLAGAIAEFYALTSYYPDGKCDPDCAQDADCAGPVVSQSASISPSTREGAGPSPFSPEPTSVPEQSDAEGTNYLLLFAAVLAVLAAYLLARPNKKL